jgi:hypothetical protein
MNLNDIGFVVNRDDLQHLLSLTPDHPGADAAADYIKWLLNNKGKRLQPFIYTAPFDALVHAVAGTPYQINVSKSADFLVLQQTYDVNIAAAAQTGDTRVWPNAKVLMYDAGGNTKFMDTDVAVTSIFGTAENPYNLPYPALWAAGSSVNVTATNYDGANDYNLHLHFHGLLVYPR